MFWFVLRKPFSAPGRVSCAGQVTYQSRLILLITIQRQTISAPAFFSDLNEQEGKKGRLFMLLSQRYSHFKLDVELHKRITIYARHLSLWEIELS